jgi:flagellar hook-associated protein 2
MVSNLENASLSSYNNQLQLLGLGSKMDTQGLLNAELNLMKLRNKPTLALQNDLKNEQSQWTYFQKEMSSFQSVIKANQLSEQNKLVSTSQEGFTNITSSNKALEGTYDLEISQLASAQRVKGEQQVTGPLNLNETVQLNGVNINITSDMSLKDIALSISQSDAGVGAVVLDNQLVMTSKKTGAANQMSFSGNAWESLGITSGGVTKNELQSATNAEYTLNGVSLTSSSNKITDIDGVEIELLKETTGKIDITVQSDTETILAKMKGLVEGYNKIIGQINVVSGEQGVFQGERIPRSIKRTMNEAIYNQQDGVFMFQAGISLDGAAKNGAIKFNEEEFLKLYNENPEKAVNVLSAFSEKLNVSLDKYTSTNGEIKGETNTITNRLNVIDKQIDTFNRNFEKQQGILVKKYAMFEVMMSQLNSQNDYISAQLGQFVKE